MSSGAGDPTDVGVFGEVTGPDGKWTSLLFPSTDSRQGYVTATSAVFHLPIGMSRLHVTSLTIPGEIARSADRTVLVRTSADPQIRPPHKLPDPRASGPP